MIEVYLCPDDANAPIPVTLVLPPEPPTQEEIDAITSAMLSASLLATDSIIGQAGRSGVVLVLPWPTHGGRRSPGAGHRVQSTPRPTLNKAGPDGAEVTVQVK